MLLPEPSEPEPPTRSQLYLQSLDKALARARIIDSSTTALLDVSDAVEDAKDEFGLSLDMRRRLSAQGITHLFAVQTALFPFLLCEPGVVNQLYRHYEPPRDVCVSAPTGSGKTLAYVVPILEILSAKVVTRLRALIVLPTQELVHQVYETIQPLAKGRHLHIAMVTGQRSFAHEQSTLVQESKRPLKGGSSKIDILICTPGRLVDHITSTPNFTLQHLRFLVIDEADRLISGSFQSWLPRVLDAIHTPPTHINDTTHSTLPYHDAVAPHLRTLSSIRITTSLDESRQSSCQKLLLSATLTQDPSKIAALKLRNPQYIVIKSTTHDTSLDGEHDEMIFDGTAALPDTLRVSIPSPSTPPKINNLPHQLYFPI
ncbi:ATP-dependent RNA helicase dbp6 [Tulasnella sp. 403]|nr:ATP-dependent RNA helicase dbp6 [Tulasnella sp. 403]